MFLNFENLACCGAISRFPADRCLGWLEVSYWTKLSMPVNWLMYLVKLNTSDGENWPHTWWVSGGDRAIFDEAGFQLLEADSSRSRPGELILIYLDIPCNKDEIGILTRNKKGFSMNCQENSTEHYSNTISLKLLKKIWCNKLKICTTLQLQYFYIHGN